MYARKNAISLLVVLGGFLAIYIGLFTPVITHLLNSHELPTFGWLYLMPITILALYVFGSYTTAFVFLQMSSQKLDIEPLFLVGAIIKAVVALALFTRKFLSFANLIVWLFLLSILGVRMLANFPELNLILSPYFYDPDHLSHSYLP